MTNDTFKGKGVLKWALSIAIILLLNLFFAVAIQVVYPQPEYTNFCVEKQTRTLINDEATCLQEGGQWNPMVPSRAGEPEGYCNEQFTCSNDYQDARETYSQNVFVTLVVLGALSLILGYFLRISPAVSAGLSYGGVLTFVIAAMRYWDSAGDIVRLGIVALALAALIVIGVKKFKE